MHLGSCIDSLLTTLALMCITAALIIIAVTPPASGYEISIYNAYPSHLWVLLIGAFSLGVAIVLRQAFATKVTHWGIVGLSIIIFTNAVFLLLPQFRGYPLSEPGNTLTHLEQTKVILNTGHLGEENIYPVIHILGACLRSVAGLSEGSTLYLFYVLFSTIYIANMYLLAKSVSSRPGQVLVVALFASPLIYSRFHISIVPQMLSTFMLPCLLYSFYRIERGYSPQSNTLILLLLVFLITFFHPITTLFAIALFLTIGLTHFLYIRFFANKAPIKHGYGTVGKNFYSVSMIIAAVFFLWYFSFASIQDRFKGFFYWWVYQVGTPLIQYQMTALGEVELTLSQTIQLFTNRYGAVFLLLVVSSVAFTYVAYKIILRKEAAQFIEFSHAGQFLVALAFGVIALSSTTFASAYPIRVAGFPAVMGTILGGLFVYDFVNKQTFTWRLALIVVTGALVLIISILGYGSVYESQRTFSRNSQVTQAQLVGSEWLFRARVANILIMTDSPANTVGLYQYLYGDANAGFDRVGVDCDLLPSHFGYTEYSQVNEALDFEDKYLAIFPQDKAKLMAYPENVRPKLRQWTENDFAKLRADPTVAQIYANGEFEVWKVSGGKK